jgi:Ca2+-binding EF-hand superfamily protein
MFSYYDRDNYGWITQDDLLDMLTTLHPTNQGVVTVRGSR